MISNKSILQIVKEELPYILPRDPKNAMQAKPIAEAILQRTGISVAKSTLTYHISMVAREHLGPVSRVAKQQGYYYNEKFDYNLDGDRINGYMDAIKHTRSLVAEFKRNIRFDSIDAIQWIERLEKIVTLIEQALPNEPDNKIRPCDKEGNRELWDDSDCIRNEKQSSKGV